jgi:hypothetical protein
MTILKRRTKRTRSEGVDFVGLRFPKKLASYISLYSLSIGVTKSSIVKAQITRWIDEQQKVVSEDDLVTEVAERALNIWENPEGKRMNFHTFISQLRIELCNKGLENYVERIISIIHDKKGETE